MQDESFTLESPAEEPVGTTQARSTVNIKAVMEMEPETLETTSDEDLETVAEASRKVKKVTPAEFRRLKARELGRQYLAEKHEGKKDRRDSIDPNLERTLERGWLLPYLMQYDDALWGRWDYWGRTTMAGRLLDEPIPQITWDNQRPFGGIKNRYVDGGLGYKHISDCLDLVTNYGRLSWTGWSSFSNINYFLDWLLFGFGFLHEEPKEPSGCKGASMRLYQFFDLAIFQVYPWDYWGDILAEQQHGRHLGFFPTPFPVIQLMVGITFLGGDGDYRAQSFMEPCMGTGRILMLASNYTLNLYGCDINETCVKASLVNGFITAPWMVKGFDFLKKRDDPEPSPEPDSGPQETSATDETEDAWKGVPIKLKKSSEIIGEQGCLF